MKIENRGCKSRFTPEQRAAAVAMIDKGMTYKEVGAIYGVWGTTIGKWSNPYKERDSQERQKALRAIRRAPKREAREAAIREAKEMYAQGATRMEMMQRFGVWHSTIAGWLGKPNGNPARYAKRQAKKRAAAVNNCDNGESKCLSV